MKMKRKAPSKDTTTTTAAAATAAATAAAGVVDAGPSAQGPGSTPASAAASAAPTPTKRVRFDPIIIGNGTPSGANTVTIAAERKGLATQRTALKTAAGEEWTCEALQVFKLRMVRSVEDLKGEATVFESVYLHQLFEKELIRGYKGLSIEFCTNAATLDVLLKISYDEKHQHADDIHAILTRVMEISIMQDEDEFIKVSIFD
jgi:Histone acetyl transferase HAT1 N-terminus